MPVLSGCPDYAASTVLWKWAMPTVEVFVVLVVLVAVLVLADQGAFLEVVRPVQSHVSGTNSAVILHDPPERAQTVQTEVFQHGHFFVNA